MYRDPFAPAPSCPYSGLHVSGNSMRLDAWGHVIPTALGAAVSGAGDGTGTRTVVLRVNVDVFSLGLSNATEEQQVHLEGHAAVRDMCVRIAPSLLGIILVSLLSTCGAAFPLFRPPGWRRLWIRPTPCGRRRRGEGRSGCQGRHGNHHPSRQRPVGRGRGGCRRRCGGSGGRRRCGPPGGTLHKFFSPFCPPWTSPQSHDAAPMPSP
jgi:hypothetical protein